MTAENRPGPGRSTKSLSPLPVLRNAEAAAGPLKGALAGIALTSAIAGFAEAAVLVVVASVATNLGAGEDGASAMSWMDERNLTNSDLLLVGLGLVLVSLVLQLLAGWASATVYTRGIARARMSVLDAHAHATWPAKETLTTASLVQLVTLNANKVGELVQSMTLLASAGANFVALLASALLIDLRGALAISLGVAVLLAITLPLIRAARRMGRSLVGMSRGYAATVHEYAAIGREVQTYGVQDASTQAMRAASATHANQLRSARFVAITSTSVFKSAALLLILALLAVVTAGGASDVASYAAVSLLLLRSVSYGQALQSNWQSVLESTPWAEDLVDERELLERSWDDESTAPAAIAHTSTAPASNAAPARASEPPRGPVTLDLARVTFAYGDDVPVFHELDLHIPAGQYVGIVGPSGAGKTTLAELVLGLRRPQGGAVQVDGTDLRLIPRHEWNRRTAFVAQDPALIQGTIRDNVRFHRPWITDEQLDVALESARVIGDLRFLPNGLDTDTGSLGNRLSGGQRQRITIARALADHPSLMVLDEPTSALDPVSEAHIAATLDELRGSATVMVIAHRWSTLQRCDRIVALGRDGLIADGGPELLADLASNPEVSGSAEWVDEAAPLSDEEAPQT